MIISESKLRMLVRDALIKEMHEDPMHRTMSGEMVPFGCPDCIDDLHSRIEDMSYNRDSQHRGTASRASYNGLLSTLRKALRKAVKVTPEEQVAQVGPEVEIIVPDHEEEIVDSEEIVLEIPPSS
jgi:hypothetical protein